MITDLKGEAATLNKNDSIWGFNSIGRELFDVELSNGNTIQALDVDGIAYLGDMILGHTKDLKENGLKVAGENKNIDESDAAHNHLLNHEHGEGDVDQYGNTRYPLSGFKWPNGVVPYVISSSLGTQGRAAASHGIIHWNANTNIRLVPRTNQRDYIEIRGGSGCSSWVGRQGGVQTVTLSEFCSRGAAVHEIGHAVGFFHEQSRHDRDNYVSIFWDNIADGMEYNFHSTPLNEGSPRGFYDFYSIMHYSTDAFSKNGRVTLWPKLPNVRTDLIRSRDILSQGDLSAASAIYGEIDDGIVYFGELSRTNASQIQPNGQFFRHNGGEIKATLDASLNNNDFDLELYGWANNSWGLVTTSTSNGSREEISGQFVPGHYYFKVKSSRGSGDYNLKIIKD